MNGSLDHTQSAMEADPVTLHNCVLFSIFLVFLASLAVIQSLVGSRLARQVGCLGVGGSKVL